MSWKIQPKHRMTRYSSEPDLSAAQDLSPDLIASACNNDLRFSTTTAAVAESSESIVSLMGTEAFDLILRRIKSTNVPVHLGAVVSAVYACRVEEKRLPKRPSKMR